MFTGIIEELGTVKQISQKGQALQLAIEAETVLEDAKLGDSISVNGVCLTVTTLHAHHFTADVMPETFRKTTLHHLKQGSKVNLERAMITNGRFGGHIVQGHVDGVGIIRQRTPEENAVVFTIEPLDHRLFRYMIDHGSIAVEGISLTIAKVNEPHFTVSIIPHTLAETVLHERQKGQAVNLECDVLGKYVERLLLYQSQNNEEVAEQRQGITPQFLMDNGFL